MPDLIGPKEAAQILGVSRQWVTELLRNGQLKGQRINRNWVLEQAEVERFKAQRNGKNGGQSAEQK